MQHISTTTHINRGTKVANGGQGLDIILEAHHQLVEAHDGSLGLQVFAEHGVAPGRVGLPLDGLAVGCRLFIYSTF